MGGGSSFGFFLKSGSLLFGIGVGIGGCLGVWIGIGFIIGVGGGLFLKSGGLFFLRIICIKGLRFGSRIRLKGKLGIWLNMIKIGGSKIILGRKFKELKNDVNNDLFFEEKDINDIVKENLFFGGFLGKWSWFFVIEDVV